MPEPGLSAVAVSRGRSSLWAVAASLTVARGLPEHSPSRLAPVWP